MSKLKKFQVTFIPNCFAHRDDPSDHKEWDYFYGESEDEVLDDVRQGASVVRCSEVEFEEGEEEEALNNY